MTMNYESKKRKEKRRKRKRKKERDQYALWDIYESAENIETTHAHPRERVTQWYIYIGNQREEKETTKKN